MKRDYTIACVIVGIGTDVVDVARFRETIARQGRKFLEKVFTAGERRYCEGKATRVEHYAARFAAKEAVLKAIGTGLTKGMRWRDVDVVRASSGRVSVKLSGVVARMARRATLHLSISHAGGMAIAVAVGER